MSVSVVVYVLTFLGAVVVALIEEAKRAGTAIIGIFHDAEVRDRVADRLFEVQPIPAAA